MADFLVGCDVGTSGTKAVVIDGEGKVYGEHYIPYELITQRPGWAEHDPEDYWRAVAGTIKASILQAGIDPHEIRGVCISAFAPACILVDKNQQPLQLSHIWMDRRGTAEAEYIREKIGEDRCFEVSGNIVDPYFGIVKLLWEKNNRPELYRQAVKIQTASDYPRMKLTGKMIIDYSSASLMGVAYDIRNKKWDTSILEELEIDPAIMPDLYACDEVIGEVTKEAAEETGLIAGTPVVGGTVDCNAAWAAAGLYEDGDMSLTMGTAGCMGFVHKSDHFTKNMISIAHTIDSAHLYTTIAATTAFGSVTRYFRDTFGDLEKLIANYTDEDAYDLLSRQAEKVPTGSDGLITLPYFMGERTPMWDPIARSMVFGWSLSHTKAHLMRSFMEGAVFAIRDNFERIRESGLAMNEPLILCEGGAKNPFWRQMLADVLGIRTGYMKEAKGAPYGDAVCAGVGVGVFKDFSEARANADISILHDPIPENKAVYDKMYPLFLKLYQDNKENYKILADITGYR